MLKKDSYILGIIIAILLPILFYGFLFLVNELIYVIKGVDNVIRTEHRVLMSIFSNLVPVRYYFVNMKADKTGRSVLFFTFILGIAFFVIRSKFPGLL